MIYVARFASGVSGLSVIMMMGVFESSAESNMLTRRFEYPDVEMTSRMSFSLRLVAAETMASVVLGQNALTPTCESLNAAFTPMLIELPTPAIRTRSAPFCPRAAL